MPWPWAIFPTGMIKFPNIFAMTLNDPQNFPFFKINHFKNESVFTTGLHIGLLSKIKVLVFPGLECCSRLNVEGFLQRSFLLAALLSGSNSRGKHDVRRGYDPLIGVLVPFGLPFGC